MAPQCTSAPHKSLFQLDALPLANEAGTILSWLTIGLFKTISAIPFYSAFSHIASAKQLDAMRHPFCLADSWFYVLATLYYGILFLML